MLRFLSALTGKLTSRSTSRRESRAKLIRTLGLESLESRDLFAGLDFSAPQYLSNGGYGTPAKLAVADLNHDGYADVVATGGYTGQKGGVQSAVNVYLNDGRGQLSIRNNYDLSNGAPHSPTLRDFNGDGQIDLMIGNANGSGALLQPGRGDGSFDPFSLVANVDRNRTLVVADFNGDGKDDEAIVSSYFDANTDSLKPMIRVMFGDGRGNFSLGPNTNIAGSATGVAAHLTAGDVNGDRLADLVLANDVDGMLLELLNTGNGSFRLVNTLSQNTPRGTKLVDTDQDGDLDLVSLGNRDNTARFWTNDGRGNFAESAALATGTGPVALVVGDINQDGRVDLAVLNQATRSVSTWEGQVQGKFASRIDFTLGQDSASVKLLPTDLALADLNKDGTLDLIVGNGRRSTIIADESRHLAVLMGKPSVVSQPGVVQLASATQVVRENAGQLALRVLRTGGSDGTVSVEMLVYGWVNRTGWATGAADFIGKRETVTFAPGETSKTVFVEILDDQLVEGSERFGVGLMNAKGGVQIGSQAWSEITIQDNDFANPGTLGFSAKSYRFAAGTSALTITVNRTGGSDGTVEVTIPTVRIVGSSSTAWATQGVDYVGTGIKLTFNPGETTKTFTLRLLNPLAIGKVIPLMLMSPTGGAQIESNKTAVVYT